MLQAQYTFQQVFDEYTTQKAMFDTVAMSLVDDVLHGKNSKAIYVCELNMQRSYSAEWQYCC